jgi:hypothetical protein
VDSSSPAVRKVDRARHCVFASLQAAYALQSAVAESTTREPTHMQHQFEDITTKLDTVTGGGKAKAIWEGAKAVYKGARDGIKHTADLVKDVGVIGAGAYGAKKAWDYVTGGGNQQPAEPGK